ncbi:MAG: hypothetical protein ACLRS8_15300 [Parabacteroides merdae]
MNLGYEGALAYSAQLVKQVASANGELVLLWHNDSIHHPDQRAGDSVCRPGNENYSPPSLKN